VLVYVALLCVARGGVAVVASLIRAENVRTGRGLGSGGAGSPAAESDSPPVGRRWLGWECGRGAGASAAPSGLGCVCDGYPRACAPGLIFVAPSGLVRAVRYNRPDVKRLLRILLNAVTGLRQEILTKASRIFSIGER
jgi:hypothetical protein